jgi:hypothetical protein
MGGSSLSGPLVFESLESKTFEQKIVFNRIEFKSMKNKDIWLMKQSHHGLKSNDWDDIKIIVHKETKPFKASYHQLKNNKEIDYKVSCLRCHSSGPRLIRPNLKSKKVMLSTRDKIKLLKWNLLIKSYGDVKVLENNSVQRKIKLSYTGIKGMNLKLKAKSCSKCHYSGGSRAPITKANKLTMKFLLKHKQMPPWPYEISKADQKEIKKFIYGF